MLFYLLLFVNLAFSNFPFTEEGGPENDFLRKTEKTDITILSIPWDCYIYIDLLNIQIRKKQKKLIIKDIPCHSYLIDIQRGEKEFSTSLAVCPSLIESLYLIDLSTESVDFISPSIVDYVLKVAQNKSPSIEKTLTNVWTNNSTDLNREKIQEAFDFLIKLGIKPVIRSFLKHQNKFLYTPQNTNIPEFHAPTTTKELFKNSLSTLCLPSKTVLKDLHSMFPLFVVDEITFSDIHDVYDFLHQEGLLTPELLIQHQSYQLLSRYYKSEEFTELLNQPNTEGEHPIHFATQKDDLKLVKFLTQHNVDLNIQSNEGFSPIHIAVQKGGVELTEFFIKQNVDLNIQSDEGLSPIHLAILNGNVKLVQLLIDHKADLDVKTTTHDSLLLFSIEKFASQQTPQLNIKELEIIKTLVNAGINLNKRNKNGQTPLEFVRDRFGPHSEVVRILEQTSNSS